MDLTKGAVHEWFISCEDKLSTGNIIPEFCAKFNVDTSQIEGIKPKSFWNKVRRLEKWKQKNRRNEKEQIEKYFSEKFEILESSTQEHPLIDTNRRLSEENISLKRQLESVPNLQEQLKLQEECLVSLSNTVKDGILQQRVSQELIDKLKKEIEANDEERSKLATELDSLEESCRSKSHAQCKTIRYRNQQIVKLKHNNKIMVQALKAENSALKVTNDKLVAERNKLIDCSQDLSQQLKSSGSLNKDMNLRKIQLERRLESLQERLVLSDGEGIAELEAECSSLKDEVSQLRAENRDLEQLVALCNSDEVVTFADGRFTDEIREVIMNLVALNVSINKVNDVIRVVLRTLLKKDVDKLRLPSMALRKLFARRRGL